jgi:hypothetical protein
MENKFLTRRELVQRSLLFSASLLLPTFPQAEGREHHDDGALHLFCLGDWGVHADPNQTAVARAMQDYAKRIGVTPQALLMLGDNFYGPLPGVDSPRWQNEFEKMYPPQIFPGPCYAILGNHDYDDQPGGEKIQMAYAKQPGTRWKMPSPWYRLELPLGNPVVTVLCVDTHYAKMSQADIAAQQHWLEAQLSAPRATPWLFVCGHHPVLSCGPEHGDTAHLRPWRDLFERHQVPLYLCGHEHDLQHLREEGQATDYLVSGGGGRALYPVLPNAKTRYAEQRFGFLHLTVESRRFTATFVGTDALPIYSHLRQLA